MARTIGEAIFQGLAGGASYLGQNLIPYKQQQFQNQRALESDARDKELYDIKVKDAFNAPILKILEGMKPQPQFSGYNMLKGDLDIESKKTDIAYKKALTEKARSGGSGTLSDEQSSNRKLASAFASQTFPTIINDKESGITALRMVGHDWTNPAVLDSLSSLGRFGDFSGVKQQTSGRVNYPDDIPNPSTFKGKFSPARDNNIVPIKQIDTWAKKLLDAEDLKAWNNATEKQKRAFYEANK